MADNELDLEQAADAARAEWCRSNLEGKVERLRAMQHKVNYIATYQASLVDGDTATGNLSLIGVPEGAHPDSIIAMIAERAAADIAYTGRNSSTVTIINLARVY